MNEHEEKREELLQRLLFEPEAESADDVRAELAADAELRERADGLRAARETLKAAGDAERDAVFREAEGLADYPGRERAEETLERLTQPAPTSPRSVWPVVIAAAAALLVGFFAYRVFFPSDEPKGDVFVGPESALSPSGEVEAYGTFTWDLPLLAGGTYEVRIWDDAEGASPDPWKVVRYLEEATWTPEPDSLPPRIRWDVRALDINGDVRASASAQASLR